MNGRTLTFREIKAIEAKHGKLCEGQPIKFGTATGRRVQGKVIEFDPGAMYPWRIQMDNGAIERFNREEMVYA